VNFLVECCEQYFTFVLAIITDVCRREEGISTSEVRHSTTVFKPTKFYPVSLSNRSPQQGVVLSRTAILML
jgi:hypothetical protein